MLRRLIRRALRSERPPPPEPDAPSAPRAAPPSPPEVEEDPPALEVEADQLSQRLRGGEAATFLDIREVHEMNQGHVQGAILLPMNQVPRHLELLPRDQLLIVYCAHGVRSFDVSAWLREQGYANAWSLAGGIGAWLETGAAWVRPPWPIPRFALTMPVRVAAHVASQHGLPTTEGTVQEIRTTGDGPVYVVGFAGPAGLVRVEGLTDADLSRA